jgi:hypothetical protein
MATRRPRKRNYKMINFKVYYDTDQDILDWWEGIEAGDRSDAMRDLIREQLEGIRRRPKLPTIDLPELLEVRRDTLWIRDALNDMPAYLERVIQHVAAQIQPISTGEALPRASPQVMAKDESALTDADAERRTKRMRKATW